MGRSMVRLALAAALCVAPRAAMAETEVEVTRGEGAEKCPSAAELRRLAIASRAPSAGSSTGVDRAARSADAPSHAYRVSFERAGGAYRADVLDETAQRVRSLVDQGPGCAPLGQAVAVVLATMRGSERGDAGTPSDPAPAGPAPPPALPDGASALRAARSTPVETSRAPPSPSRSRWIFGAGSGLAAAIVRPLAPSFLADAALERASLSLALGALWIPQQRLGLGQGVVDVQLLAGTARGCVFAGDGTRLGACTRLLAGALRAGGSGYDVDARETRPWFAAALEIFVGGPLPVAPLRYRASIGAIVPLHAEAFSVAGRGPAYDTPALGGLFTLSLEIAP